MIQPPLKLWEHQTRIVSLTEEILREQTSLLVAAPTGSGKCHPAGTMILMYDGSLKAVESIVPGDQLMAPDSQPRKVRSTSTGYGPIVEIWPVKGKPWRCNDEHVLTLVRTGENDRPENRSWNRDGEIVNISVKEYRGMSKYYKHIHKLFRPGEIQFHHPKDRRESLIPPYILGLLLGDGDLTNGRVGVTTVDAPVVKALKEYAEQIQVRLVRVEDPDRTPSYYFRRAHTAISNPSLNHCRTLGISEHRAGDKFIPDRYKTALPEDRLELLAGLMDTDGHLHQDTKTGYDYLSKSKRLAKDVCFVARSLGLAAHLRIKTQAEGIYWRVSISGETNRIPCRIPRKQAKPRLQKKNHLRTGFTIRDLGHKKYYGFTLDGDGRYLLDDFTVTHNTVCLSEISRDGAEKRPKDRAPGAPAGVGQPIGGEDNPPDRHKAGGSLAEPARVGTTHHHHGPRHHFRAGDTPLAKAVSADGRRGPPRRRPRMAQDGGAVESRETAGLHRHPIPPGPGAPQSPPL